MNMVNFLDGLDGLAAGVCAIAGRTFVVLALSLEKTDPAILSAIIAGACIGFLRHNFFPARIFMGDSGALVLGFLLAAVSVQGLLKTASTVVLFLPLLVLAVPILDTSFVVARRLKHGQPVSASRPGAPALPLPPARLLAAPRGADDVGAGARRSRRPRSPRASSRSARAATGTCRRRSPPARSGSSRSPFSVYVVYLLEIVKLANPRVRRREEAAAPRAAAPPSSRAREERGERLVEAGRALGRVAGAGEDGALGVAARARARRRSRRTPRGGRRRRRASGTAPRAASRAGSRPPTARARPSASARLARAPAAAATAGRTPSRRRAGTCAGTPPAPLGPSRQSSIAPAAKASAAGARARPTSPAARSPSASRAPAPRRGREQRDHAAVGVAAEVVAGLELLGHPLGVAPRNRPAPRAGRAGSRDGSGRRARSCRRAAAARPTSPRRS